MKKEQLRVLGKLARAFEACADQEHESYKESRGERCEFGQLPVSPRALAHYRGMQAFQWCLEAVEEEIEVLKEGCEA